MSARREPFEKSDGLKMRFVYWMMRRKFGKVMAPVKVVTARMRGSLGLNRKLQKSHKRIQLEPALELMVGTLSSGAAFVGTSRSRRQSSMDERPSKTSTDKL